MATTRKIRQSFIDFFKGHQHRHLSSSPLVPHGDPSLMFTNAGMNQFKGVFTGAEKAPGDRAVTVQKCVRAGGKHNDLENVGYTARHHTFFEMLGNFSFGDYFKREAIRYAWTLLTEVYGIDPKRLVITVYHDDEEAFTLWHDDIKVPAERIIKISTSDNFWSMGDTGPCGPCSEIFFDHGSHIPGGPPGSPEEDGDRFVEIWNLVFMQYEQESDGSRRNLPRPCIDTGSGLERLAAVLQGVHSNYETDLFKNLITSSTTLYGAQGPELGVSHRVIADHLRAIGFLIADGVLPENEGRGNVLRRIMRRAMRHAHLLGSRTPQMHALVPSLLEEMGEPYGELGRAQDLITNTLYQEEERFQRTLGRGIKLLEDAVSDLPHDALFSGDLAFKLFDTYGFPLDLTEDILRGYHIRVDRAAYEKAMAAQKDRARASWKGSTKSGDFAQWSLNLSNCEATNFLGYKEEGATATILAIIVDGTSLERLEAGQTGWVVCDQTPFYAEAGGQVADQGLLIAAEAKAEIHDCQRFQEDYLMHATQVTQGHLAVGDPVTLSIDTERRAAIKRNHSATHLLHQALRKTLGPHVAQKGSLVAPHRLRFDFSHTGVVTSEEIHQIEACVNHYILQNTAVETTVQTPDAAFEAGAVGLFGEKYGDQVRVVRMGATEPAAAAGNSSRATHSGAASPYSMELCGGTHVNRTGDIGVFKIISEANVSAGVRRLEAITGTYALAHAQQQDQLLGHVADRLKSPKDKIGARLEALVQEKRSLAQEVEALREKALLSGDGAQDLTPPTRLGNSVVYTARVMFDVPAQKLKGIADNLLPADEPHACAAVLSTAAEKVSVVVALSQPLTQHISAVELVRAAAAALGGKGGGGRPEIAQGGGSNPEKVPDAIECIKGILAALPPV